MNKSGKICSWLKGCIMALDELANSISTGLYVFAMCLCWVIMIGVLLILAGEMP